MNLANRGYDVATAADGRTALALAQHWAPDLLILDLGLPDIDGLEVIREFRSRRPDLPIVVLSARNTSHDKVLALDLGAVDYVTKPFDMNQLVARLQVIAHPISDGSH
jgi:two-component system KDP operon response regulator KdpE